MRKKNVENNLRKIIILFVVVFGMISTGLALKQHMQSMWMKNLSEAIRNEDEKKVDKLLEDKSGFMRENDVNKTIEKPLLDIFGEMQDETPLVYACEAGNYHIVHSLIKAGADVNYTREGHFTPLETSIMSFDYVDDWREVKSIVAELIEGGADIEHISFDDYSMYELAAGLLPYEGNSFSEGKENDIFEIYCMLIEEGKSEEKNRKNAFREAVEVNNFRLVRYLLNQDATLVNMRIEDGEALLFALCENMKSMSEWKEDYLKTMEILVDNGADLSYENEQGETVQEYAERIGEEEVVELIESKID